MRQFWLPRAVLILSKRCDRDASFKPPCESQIQFGFRKRPRLQTEIPFFKSFLRLAKRRLLLWTGATRTGCVPHTQPPIYWRPFFQPPGRPHRSTVSPQTQHFSLAAITALSTRGHTANDCGPFTRCCKLCSTSSAALRIAEPAFRLAARSARHSVFSSSLVLLVPQHACGHHPTQRTGSDCLA
jgi:hypothetical protein